MDRPAPTDESVRLLADLLGVRVDPERIPAITAHLADLLAVAAVLDDLDLNGVAPAAVYDPRWPEEAL